VIATPVIFKVRNGFGGGCGDDGGGGAGVGEGDRDDTRVIETSKRFVVGGLSCWRRWTRFLSDIIKMMIKVKCIENGKILEDVKYVKFLKILNCLKIFNWKIKGGEIKRHNK
jgi:hypothetical protein